MLPIVLGQIPVAAPVSQQGSFSGGSLPVVVLVALGLLGLSAAGLLYARKLHLRKTVEERFTTFRAGAVALMDRLDSLRLRHKTLPETDPDFTVPMSGATLDLYERVSRDLDGLWERWLKIMDVWDQTQRQIRTGARLASKPTEEARKLLAGDEVNELLRESQFCHERLDRLNQAHEVARESLAAARADLAAIQHQVTKGTGVLLPSDAFHQEIEGAETMLGQAEMTLGSDPIGALEQITRTSRAMAALGEVGRPGPATSAEAATGHPVLDELSAAAERLRAAAGLLRVTDLLGFLVRSWVAVCALGLVLFLLLPLLLPLFLLAVIVMLGLGAWFFWHVMALWLATGPRR